MHADDPIYKACMASALKATCDRIHAISDGRKEMQNVFLHHALNNMPRHIHTKKLCCINIRILCEARQATLYGRPGFTTEHSSVYTYNIHTQKFLKKQVTQSFKLRMIRLHFIGRS
jgi:hypothetical protein